MADRDMYTLSNCLIRPAEAFANLFKTDEKHQDNDDGRDGTDPFIHRWTTFIYIFLYVSIIP